MINYQWEENIKKKKKRQETGIIVFHFLTQQYFPTVWKDGMPLRNWAKHYLHQLWYSSTTTGLLNSSEKVWNKYVLWPFGWFVFLKQCFAPFPFLPPSTAPLLISHSILSINYIEWEETDMKCQQNFTFPKPANTISFFVRIATFLIRLEVFMGPCQNPYLGQSLLTVYVISCSYNPLGMVSEQTKWNCTFSLEDRSHHF